MPGWDTMLVFSASLLLRYGVSLWPHSGEGHPPLHGDFEAQRHWQEITVNLPVKDWYNNTKDNDLLYWGLDYPPLTAYHSYAVGKVAEIINSSYVSLHKSRGIETPDHKLFMRLSVIVADLLVYFPAIYYSASGSLTIMILLGLFPGLILIDHGHFQYNNISLGLALAAMAAVCRDADLLGSMLFCLALNYKQMELYHALPFFFFLLAKCANRKGIFRKLLHLTMIGSAVILTFGLVWSPFISLGLDSTLQVLKRVFPVDRGVFEDKVANVWCSVDILLKLKAKLSVADMTKLCAGATILASLPSNIHLYLRPSAEAFKLALVNTSLAFFLFSYHVHEKTILLVSLPVMLTWSTGSAIHNNTIIPWVLAIHTFSMAPLLYKDGLLIPSVALTVLFLTLLRILPQTNSRRIPDEPSATKGRTAAPMPISSRSTWWEWLCQLSFWLSLVGCCILISLMVFYPPPERYPFLWPTVISVYSALHFIIFYLYFHWLQLGQSSPSSTSSLQSKKKKN